MDEQRVLVILNAQNNFIGNTILSSPLNYNYCKIITNTQCLIKVSFLKTGYAYTAGLSTDFEPVQGLVLAGSKFAYAVGERQITNFTVKLGETPREGLEELQLVFYFFNTL